MNQNIWGPHAWFFLHTISLAYPQEPCQKDKDGYRAFFQSLAKVIPCEICKTHYNRNLKETPPRLENRKDLFEWSVDLHNEINGRTGKRPYSYQEALKIYEEAYQKKFALTTADNPTVGYLMRLQCWWIQYHAYLIIVVLLGVIFYLLGGLRGIKKLF